MQETATNSKNIKFYRSPLGQDALVLLLRRNNALGAAHLFGHIGILFITGGAFYYLLSVDLYFPAVVILWLHGTVFAFLGWAGAGHEFSHRTVFSSRIVNEGCLKVFSFLTWSNHVYFTRSHISHHKWTLSESDDLEISPPQQFNVTSLGWAFTIDIPAFLRNFKALVLNSFGTIPGEKGNRVFPPCRVVARQALFWWARLILIGQLSLATCFIVSGEFELVFLVNMAPFIGTWITFLLALGQHYGMELNGDDFRNNSRTVLLGPIMSFLYWNMNYHVEHHMYPGVPYYNLPKLRAEVEEDLSPPIRGFASLTKEIFRIKFEERARQEAL